MMQGKSPQRIATLFCVLAAVSSVAQSASPSASPNAGTPSAAPQGSPSSGPSNYVTFDLHNDPTLNFQPPDVVDGSKPTAAMFCYRATQVGAASQPIIVAADYVTDLDKAFSFARLAIQSAQSAIGYYEAYEMIPMGFPENFSASVRKKSQDRAKGLKDYKKVAYAALADLEKAMRNAQHAVEEKQWAEYEHQIRFIRQAIDKTSAAVTGADDVLSTGIDQPLESVQNDDSGHISAVLTDLTAKGKAAIRVSAAQIALLDASPINSLVPNSGPRCADPSGVAPMRMGMDLYIRIDFTAIDAKAWNDLKLITLGVTASASSPINTTPLRAGISQPTTTVLGNVSSAGASTSDANPKIVAPRTSVVQELEARLPANCKAAIDRELKDLPEFTAGESNYKGDSWASVIKGLEPVLPKDCKNPLDGEVARESGESAFLANNSSRVKYLKWPYPLAGDTNVSVSVSLLYTPPNSPGLPDSDRYYPVGSVIFSATCFAAIKDPIGPNSSTPGTDPSQWWPLSGCNSVAWNADVAYPAGALVSNGSSCYFAKRAVPAAVEPSSDVKSWGEMPTCYTTAWVATATYQAGTLVSGTPVCYQAQQGSPSPWQQLPSCPTTTQAAPVEPTVTLVSQTLPPVHALSRFNLSAAVVYSSIKNRTYGFQQDNTTKTPCGTSTATVGTGTNAMQVTTNYDCVQTGSTPIIDPVLFFTYYPWALDAERPWWVGDLRPGVSLGISLSSPSSNFYFGLSHELLRNVQLVYGFTIAKRAYLTPMGTFNSSPTSSSATPATVQKFDKGYFVGISFNILGFIQSLTGGGGGGGAAAASKAN